MTIGWRIFSPLDSMVHSLTVLGGQLLGMILIITGTVLGLDGSRDSEPIVGTSFGFGETPAGVVLFAVGITALVFATLRGSAPTSSISKPLRAIQRPAIGKASTAEPWAAARETSSVQESASSLEALIRWNEQEYEQSTSGPLRQANAVPAAVEQSSQAPKYPFGDA